MSSNGQPTVNLPSLPGFNLPEYRVYRESEALAELDTLVPAAAREWCQPTMRVLHGRPYEQVLQAAATSSVDLIVVGVHGRTALDLMIFGSTTNQVIRGASCPVLTIRSWAPRLAEAESQAEK